jgi:hypothetical protein
MQSAPPDTTYPAGRLVIIPKKNQSLNAVTGTTQTPSGR